MPFRYTCIVLFLFKPCLLTSYFHAKITCLPVSGGIVPCFIKMLCTDGLMADTLKQCICSLAQICSFSSKGRGQFVGQLGPEVLIELAFMHEKKHDLIAACILLATELSCDQQGSSTKIFDAIEMCSESSF
mmetsp:Transcript_11078/g.16763  ORF Transcript_11078/g.16763 Transcript_11078/m.16763 type:complete len:131 (+) Transcript_11078:1088-1480(+)